MINLRNKAARLGYDPNVWFDNVGWWPPGHRPRTGDLRGQYRQTTPPTATPSRAWTSASALASRPAWVTQIRS